MKKLLKDHPWAERIPLPERLKEPLLRFYDRFMRIHGEPHEVARGLALGIAIGFTPTMGIQMPIALVVASIFKQNKISALLGVWISNPLSAPILYGFTYFVGAKMLGIEITESLRIPQGWGEMKQLGLEIFLPLWVGGIAAGLASFPITYHFGLKAIKGYRAARRRLKEHRARKSGGKDDPDHPAQG